MNMNARIACAAALLAAVAVPASANHSAAIANPTTYVAHWTYVPDLDQRRALLPNTGAMYCVPTSAMNWMVYIAHHGHPSVAPGDQPYWSWLAPQAYNPMTSTILNMGALMGTDEYDGTNGSGKVSGLNAWLAGKGFLVFNFWTHGGTTIRFQDIADWTLAGVPVMPSVGWYSGTEPVLTRAGGHALSVTDVARSGNNMEIAWRDPADDNTVFSQSLFVSQEYALDPRVVFVKGYPRVMDKVVGYGSGWIDGMCAIVPLSGLTTTDDSLNLTFLKPVKFNWDASQIIQHFDPQFSSPIRAVKYIPGSPEALVLTDPVPGTADPAVFCVNAQTAEVKPIGLVPGAERFTFGRNRETYFLTAEGGIMCYPLSNDIPWDITASTAPPNPCKGLTYDDATDMLLALAMDGAHVYRYPKTLAEDPESFRLPPDPIYPWEPDAEMSIAVSPLDGSWFITNAIADSVLHIMDPTTARASAELIAEGELVNPHCVHIGDDGAMYVVSDDMLREYRYMDEAGGWEEERASLFAGLPVPACLDFPHSRDNEDPDQMPLEEFHNDLPTEFSPDIPDCPADMNGDNVVDGEDLATLLALWNESGDLTDLNGDGTTDGADLAVLLAAWGDCN